jgi:hypothetical protein
MLDIAAAGIRMNPNTHLARKISLSQAQVKKA